MRTSPISSPANSPRASPARSYRSPARSSTAGDSFWISDSSVGDSMSISANPPPAYGFGDSFADGSQSRTSKYSSLMQFLETEGGLNTKEHQHGGGEDEDDDDSEFKNGDDTSNFLDDDLSALSFSPSRSRATATATVASSRKSKYVWDEWVPDRPSAHVEGDVSSAAAPTYFSLSGAGAGDGS
jgi:hypothetical protein